MSFSLCKYKSPEDQAFLFYQPLPARCVRDNHHIIMLILLSLFTSLPWFLWWSVPIWIIIFRLSWIFFFLQVQSSLLKCGVLAGEMEMSRTKVESAWPALCPIPYLCLASSYKSQLYLSINPLHCPGSEFVLSRPHSRVAKCVCPYRRRALNISFDFV